MIADDDGHPSQLTQSEKFKEAARALGIDENDEAGFTEMVRRIAVLKPKDAVPEGHE